MSSVSYYNKYLGLLTLEEKRLILTQALVVPVCDQANIVFRSLIKCQHNMAGVYGEGEANPPHSQKAKTRLSTG